MARCLIGLFATLMTAVVLLADDRTPIVPSDPLQTGFSSPKSVTPASGSRLFMAPIVSPEEQSGSVFPTAFLQQNPPVPPTPPRDKAHPDVPLLPQPSAPQTGQPANDTADKEKELNEKLGTVGKSLEALSKNMTITTGDPNIKVLFGGAIIGDFLFNTARPVAPGTPFFLAPGPIAGFNEKTFDAQARQSLLFAYISGPEFCGFESAGVVAFCFYEGSIIEDKYGILPLQVYAQLKNDDWRFAAGVQWDIFNPLNPTILPFSYLGGSGNAGGSFPAQIRAERYIHLADDAQVTITTGLSNPISTTVSNSFVLSEDNGWPNVESRIALGLGCREGQGPMAKRPFEIGISGLVGQIRTTIPQVSQVVADVWGLGTDVRWAITHRFGMQGELFTGQTLGTYTAGILQNINSATLEGVQTSGAWVEMYYYICPETIHSHIGYGIDDPLDRDLAPGQPVRNETYFANVIWDPNKYFRFGIELTYRKTAWTAFDNNDGVGIQSQVQFKF